MVRSATQCPFHTEQVSFEAPAVTRMCACAAVMPMSRAMRLIAGASNDTCAHAATTTTHVRTPHMRVKLTKLVLPCAVTCLCCYAAASRPVMTHPLLSPQSVAVTSDQRLYGRPLVHPVFPFSYAVDVLPASEARTLQTGAESPRLATPLITVWRHHHAELCACKRGAPRQRPHPNAPRVTATGVNGGVEDSRIGRVCT